MTAVASDPAGGILTLRVARVRDEVAGIRSFVLESLDASPLPPFDAGAHLDVEVEPGGGRADWRSYSLLGDPRDRRAYRIAVRLEAAGRGGSRFLHERVGAGSRLRVTTPQNGFRLSLEAPHSVLIAGGIGITPLLSMLRELVHHGRSVELHYAARTTAQLVFRQEIDALLGERAHLYVSQAVVPRRLHPAAILRAAPPGSHVYACGPSSLLRDVRFHADALGWPAPSVHIEHFGATRHADDRAVTLHLARSGGTVSVAPGETLLDALLAAGVWAPYECRRGECASCVTPVLSGIADHRDACLSPALRATHICPCVSRAHTDSLTLDL